MRVTNIDIIEEFKKGTSKGFSGIYDLYFTRIWSFAIKLLGNNEEAKDIAITSFSKLFERSKDFETEANIRAYLFVSARNGCYNLLKHKKVVSAHEIILCHQLTEESKSLDPDMIEAEYIHLVYNAIEQLPPARKQVFKMMYIQGLSISEISQQLGISIKTVKNVRGIAIDNIRSYIASL